MRRFPAAGTVEASGRKKGRYTGQNYKSRIILEESKNKRMMKICQVEIF